MAKRAPRKCPACKSSAWTRVDNTKKGYSVGKAAAGAVLLGPVGLVGGALGKKVNVYYCPDCRFENTYKK